MQKMITGNVFYGYGYSVIFYLNGVTGGILQCQVVHSELTTAGVSCTTIHINNISCLLSDIICSIPENTVKKRT